MPRPSTPEEAMRGSSLVRTRVSRGFVGSWDAYPTARTASSRGAVRGTGRRRSATSRVREVLRQPGDLRLVHQEPQQVGSVRRGDPVSLVFADIRGSTTIGQRSSPTEYRGFLDRFYRLSSKAILDNDGMVDKFVGDEAIGLFFAGISGKEHAAAAIRAARALIHAVGHPDASPIGPIPVGAAVHTGDAFVGSTGGGGGGVRLHGARRRGEHHGSAGERSGGR